jgi:hypothetical protein
MRFLSCILVVTVACSRREQQDDSAGARTFAHATQAAVPERMRGGDVRIVDVDSTVDLALVGDTITAGLSANTVAKVRRETDTSTVTGEGVGASIERMVKGTVGQAIGTRVAFPVATVKEIHYESGRLLFDWNGKPLRLFGTATVNGKPITWRAEDAQRFIDAVHARQAAAGRR